ncbi:MAG: hypothetical protein Ct9H300mP19_16390 [Dehalococcoidia bacterium]|nr:MAG: hypothetical protein Ct9H300mP19_16390 [Dehalococcoidia bacterium]
MRMAPFVVGDTVIQGITSLRIPEGGWIDGIDRTQENTNGGSIRFHVQVSQGDIVGMAFRLKNAVEARFGMPVPTIPI